ncbi:ATP-binding protein [Saccharopolyspora sp. HNM0986]|nr:ATP-binding protein [Saccharopolyspora sp. HNM0986]
MTPWWQALKIRREIISASGQIDDVQMSLFQAVHGAGALRPEYANPTYYGDITHPTGRLVDLLAEIAIRLGGGNDYLKARSVTRLDQGMGGGKSHACVGCYHLASSSSELACTDLGQAVFAKARSILGRDLPADLNNPHVVVLPCDNMTPGAPDQQYDGPATNLYERFLWRLFSKDYALYEHYAPYFNDKSKIVEALGAVNRPVLILIDEIMDYVGNGLDGADKPELAAQDMAFLRALLDASNDLPNVAMIVVMIDSDALSLGEVAKERRADLHGLLERNGMSATVTTSDDFSAILRRRLFEQMPSSQVVASTAEAYESVLADRAWSRHVWEAFPAPWRDNFASEVARTYPFHPQLMHLAEKEWAQVSGFQRVRSTIRVFAATVFAQQQRGQAGHWVPALIGPGDLPLSDNNVREAVLGSGLVGDARTIANFRSLAEIEIVNQGDDDGAARRLDRGRDELVGWSESNPRASERAATYIFLTSVVGVRPGGRRGASAPEVKAATTVPDSRYGVADADGVVEDVVHQDLGMSAVEVVPGHGNNKPARYYLSTKLTYRMLVNNIKRSIIGEAEAAAAEGRGSERDAVIAEFAENLSNSGPFKKKIFVTADVSRPAAEVLATAGLDDARTTRLVLLDPAQFSLRNGTERATMEALTAATGLGDGSNRQPVEWASSAVFAAANSQRRTHARVMANEYLARLRALQTPEVESDDELKATGKRELADAKSQLEKAIRRAYQHVVYVYQPDPFADRSLDQINFDDDHHTALDGTLVWKALVDREKAFNNSQFTAKALLHNLREQDYGRPLPEIRDAFWKTPRLPLLYAGDTDLQHAIYQAVQAGDLCIVDANGNDVEVTDPAQVNLSSMGLRLAKPRAEAESEGADLSSGSASPGGAGAAVRGGRNTRAPYTPEPTEADGEDENTAATEKYVSFPLVGALLDNPDKTDGLAQVFRVLYSVLDENKVSYAQGTLQLVLDAEAADKLAATTRELGINVTMRDQ